MVGFEVGLGEMVGDDVLPLDRTVISAQLKNSVVKPKVS